MKFVDEYRDKELVYRIAEKIKSVTTKPWIIMEICGGQTHSIMKYSLQNLLPKEIELVHGPGCPVCVTPIELIDKAIQIAQREDVIFTSYGDMLRVPGSSSDLLSVKASGGDVRIVYSPLDILKLAKENPAKKIIFFAVGFETTAPAISLALTQAKKNSINNIFILNAHVLVPPAMEAILSSPRNKIQGFIAAGHVCTVMGYKEYHPIAAKYNVPIVVTGFEPVDVLHGILELVKLLEGNEVVVKNAYGRSVLEEGNIAAQKMMLEVFEPTNRNWRGIGEIPKSGLNLTKEYTQFDAETLFELKDMKVEESKECIAGEILQGLKKPNQCPAFKTKCNPDNPLGAPMVSSEGACAAYYRY